MSVLAAADPADNYSQLGLAFTYHPGSQTVRPKRGREDLWIRWTTIGCVALLALIAGTASYLHMPAHGTAWGSRGG